MKIKNLFFVAMFIFLASCYEVNTIEGNYILPDQLKQITVGVTKQQVFNLIGAPTYKSAFNQEIWYYTYEIYNRKLSFTAKKITDYKTIIITFANNKVAQIQTKTINDRQKVNFVKDATADTLKKSAGDSKTNHY